MAVIKKCVLGLTLICFCDCSFANNIDIEGANQVSNITPNAFDSFTLDETELPSDIEALIEKIEYLSSQAEKTTKEGILPIEHINKIHSSIEDAVEELVDLSNETMNIYKFLNAKGVERVVMPNIGIPHPPLKRQLLILIKNLFDLAPITTNAVMPIGVVDKILDIFEHDNLALKAHALDILYIWLPENPVIQTRVMKMKGLEPFYRQIPKLDADVIGQLLDLFNKILVEHVKARRKDVQRTKADHDVFVMYQKIGLLERISTSAACNGMLYILETTWSYNTEEKELSQPIIEAIKNVQPFCKHFFKANPKRTNLFHDLLKYIEDPNRKSDFEKMSVNVTDVQIILKDYSNIFNDVLIKDEF